MAQAAQLALAGRGKIKEAGFLLPSKARKSQSHDCPRNKLLGIIFFVVFSSSVFGVAPAVAQENPTIINVRNAGGFDCNQFLGVMRQENNPIDKTAFLQWAAAYTTAFSRSLSLIDAFPIIDTTELLIMTSLVCVEDGAMIFEVALRTVLFRLEAFWIRSSPEIINLTDPLGRNVEFFAEATNPFQEALNQFGARVTVDGTYGNQTGNAVRRLNEARSMTPWLTPDGELLYQLTKP